MQSCGFIKMDVLGNQEDAMTTDLVMTNDRQLSTIGAGRMDTNAAAVYLARLAPSSRDTMRRALGIVARMLTGDEAADYLAVPWPALRFQHCLLYTSRCV